MREPSNGAGMLTREQATEIADAIHRLRSRWTTDDLIAVMLDPRIRDHRNMRDTASALAWLALDIRTQSPARLFAPGQWWNNAKENPDEQTAPYYRPLAWDDCHDCGRAKAAHPTRDCAYTKPSRADMPDDARAAIRAALTPNPSKEQA